MSNKMIEAAEPHSSAPLPEATRTLRLRAIAALVLTALLWSSSGVLIKLINWNPIAIAGARSAISTIVLLLYLRRPKFTWSASQLLAALFYALMMFAFVAANKLTTSANAIFLQYLAPVFVAVLGIWMLGEKPSRTDWLIIAVVIGGMALFFVDRISLTAQWGNVLAVLAGVFMAFFFIFMRRQKDGSPLESIVLGHAIAAIAATPFYFADGPRPELTGWIAIFALGAVQVGLSSITLSFAIRHLTALGTSIISLLEPVLNPVWVFLFLGESPSIYAILGGTVILAMVSLRSVLAVRRAQSGALAEVSGRR